MFHVRDEPIELLRTHRGSLVEVVEFFEKDITFAPDTFLQGDQGDGEVRQGPVKVGAARLLEHLFQGTDGGIRDGQALQVANNRGVLAQVARHGEHRLGGSDGVVEAAQGHLGAEPHLERVGQGLELLQVGEQHAHAVALQLEPDLPVGRVEPGGPVGLAQSAKPP